MAADLNHRALSEGTGVSPDSSWAPSTEGDCGVTEVWSREFSWDYSSTC